MSALVLPIADRIGRDAGERMGDAISRHLVVTIPDAVNRGGQAAQRAAARQGNDTGGAFARSIRTTLTAAFRAMPRLDVRLSDTGVDAQLARIRAQMEQLANKTIGVDIDAVAAEAQIRRFEIELERLGASHPNVDVRADTATARAALADIRAMIAAVDASDPRVKVDIDTSGASSALMSLGVQAAAVAAIPVGPALAAGLGSVVAMASAAVAGIGALGLAAVPAIKGVTEAVQLKSAAEKESASATQAGANAGAQAAQRALSQASAQQSLASAHRNAASSIAAAERAVANAAERAAEQRRTAAEAVRRAEQSLTDAKRTARDAERDLTRARADAASQLRALNGELEDGALAQREAVLRVKEAEEELRKVMSGPSTDLDKEAAQLAYDRAVAGAKRQAESYADLQKSAEQQRRAGVEGSDAVRAAQERVGQANRNVAEQTRVLADAQAGVTKAQRDGARSVADAQERAAEAQVSAAESIANAQRGVESARLSATKTTAAAITKEDELREALAKLSPEARDLYESFAGPKGLSVAFKAWSKELEPETLPIFTRAVDAAKNSLPGLTPLVEAASRGIDTLMDSASKEVKSPFWDSFREDLGKSVEPAVVGLGKAIGNTFKGAAGVVDAFLPHMEGISRRASLYTSRFARWATGLKGSPEFERFLAYVKETVPTVSKFLGSAFDALLSFTQAISPLSTAILATVTPLFDAVSWLAVNMPELVVALWALYAAQKAITIGMAAFAGAMFLYESVMIVATIVTGGFAVALGATGLVPIIRAVVLVVGLLVVGVIAAYNHIGWFKTSVDALGAAALWLWNSVLKPVFAAIWTGIQAIGTAAVWLWENALGPAFRFIGEAAQLLITGLITLLLLPAYLAIKALGAIGVWLWDVALGPAFGWIGDKATWLWEKIRPAFGESKKTFQALGDVAKWLWEKAISPAFDWIADKAGWLYEKAIKPSFDNIKTAMKLVSDSFEFGRKAIKRSWDQVEGIAKEPVRFILDVVYNGGVVPLWNAVAGITGAKELKPFNLEKFATGGVHGVRPGYTPGRDNQVIAVGGGEAIMRPEWTRVIGEEQINSWNAAARSGGVAGVQRAVANGIPAFASGGIVGWLKSAGNDVGDFLSGAADFLNPVKVFSKATDFAKEQLAPYLTNPWAREVGKIPTKILSGLKDAALRFLGFGDDGPTSGGGKWLRPVNAPFGTPFGKAGSMWSSGYHTGLDFPAAVGTAIHAVAAGRVTQATSGGPYGKHVSIAHGGGLSSLYAHMSQIAARAGQIADAGELIGRVGATGNVTGPHLHLEARRNGVAVNPLPYLYDDGGYLPPGLNLVANGTGRPEPVLTTSQWDAIRAGGGRGDTIVNVEVSTTLDGRELTGHVDKRIEVHDAEMARSLNVGRSL
ncbi:peptidoglycan DD-metalloendopeptidase family protein [Streptomyces sp. NPDC059743]|uniref:peptidoglycan DD-metalloendopeptidase family protein n=1 Tax=Streptomyces sp. NPDC059743 TaxID=3346928 RepID=UPI003650230D